MYPSSWRMRAISTFCREVGISAVSCSALLALRMRVSMSAIGSVCMVLLPARLRHARDLPVVRELAQADPAEAELAIDGAGAAAAPAARVLPHLESRLALLLVHEGLLSQRAAPVLRREGRGCGAARGRARRSWRMS